MDDFFIQQLGSVFNKMVKSVIYLLFSYQVGNIMWHWHYENPTQRVCLEQSGPHHHLIEN
jgi:hypothetical protein